MVLMPLIAKEVATGIIKVTSLVRRRHRKGSIHLQELGCIIGVVDYILSRNPDSSYILFRTNFVIATMAYPRTIAAVDHNLPLLFHIAIVVKAFHLSCN